MLHRLQLSSPRASRSLQTRVGFPLQDNSVLGNEKIFHKMAAISTTKNHEKVTQRMRDFWRQYKGETQLSGIAVVYFLVFCTRNALAVLLVQQSGKKLTISDKFEMISLT